MSGCEKKKPGSYVYPCTHIHARIHVPATFNGSRSPTTHAHMHVRVYASGIFCSVLTAALLLNIEKLPNHDPRFAAFLARCSSSVFCTRRSGRICLPVMVLVISRRGGLGVSISEADFVSMSSLSSLGGALVEGTLDEGLLLVVLMGMPKKEFLGDTRPGDNGAAAAGGARNMFVTMLPEGTSEVERRW